MIEQPQPEKKDTTISRWDNKRSRRLDGIVPEISYN